MALEDIHKQHSVTWLALFTSMSTLLCCALPIVLVSLGLGAGYAALTDSLPWLITLGKYKAVTFIVAAGLIAASVWLSQRPGRRCPSDPQLAAHCLRLQKWNKRLLILAGIGWSLGFFAAYLALPLQMWLDG